MKNFITVILAALMTCGFAFYQSQPPREIIIEVPEKQREFREYLKDAARAYGVPNTLAAAMVWQESKGRMDSIRFEPGQMERARKVTKAAGEQLRMYSSSHCSLQIMGYNAATMGISWAELYSPQMCAEVGMKIMGSCLNRHKEKEPVDRAYQALKCYNGGDEYARDILNRLGKTLLAQHLSQEMKS